jgi:hypothetical protein
VRRGGDRAVCEKEGRHAGRDTPGVGAAVRPEHPAGEEARAADRMAGEGERREERKKKIAPTRDE